MSERLRRTGAVLLGVLLLASCATGEYAPDDPAGGAAGGRRVAAHRVEHLRVEVLRVFPARPASVHPGTRDGRATRCTKAPVSGRSSVRAGPLGKKPTVRTALPAPLFGEGITVLGRTLWQLTWRNRIAIERDARTLRELRRVPYPDDGWGVCLERARHRLVTSDGSSRLTFRDPRSLAKTGEVAVTEGGRPVTELNELECVGAAVYANVLFTDRIVRIDPVTGAVTASIDASGLLRDDGLVPGSALNGIAAVPAARSVPDHREVLAKNVPRRAGPGLTDGRPRPPFQCPPVDPSPPGPGCPHMREAWSSAHRVRVARSPASRPAVHRTAVHTRIVLF